MIDEKQVKKMVAELTSQVVSEVRDFDAARFKVTDLQDQVKELAGENGITAAWAITYDTSSGLVKQGTDVIRKGLDSAWAITYNTSSGASLSQIREK